MYASTSCMCLCAMCACKYCVLCVNASTLFVCSMLVYRCVFVYMCVCLCPSESNGPWRQASVHQQTAGISALPEYRWTTGAWQRAPPRGHRIGWVYVRLCVCACVPVINTKWFWYIHLYTHRNRERDVSVCLRHWVVCVWPLTSGYVSQLCVSMCVCACVTEGPPGCHRSHTHQAST